MLSNGLVRDSGSICSRLQQARLLCVSSRLAFVCCRDCAILLGPLHFLVLETELWGIALLDLMRVLQTVFDKADACVGCGVRGVLRNRLEEPYAGIRSLAGCAHLRTLGCCRHHSRYVRNFGGNGVVL